MKNIAAFISSSIVTALIWAGTTAYAKEAVTLKFWHTMNKEESKTLKELIKDFELNHKNIKVDLQPVPFGDGQQKFRVAGIAGQTPDIGRAEIAWVPEFAEMGILKPLDSMVSKEEKGDYLENVISSYVYKDKLWGLPQVTDCLALFYNKNMLDKAKVKVPETMEELIKAAPKINGLGKDVSTLGINPWGYWSLPFIYAYGGQLIDEKKRESLIDSPASVKGLTVVHDLVHKHKVIDSKMDFPNGYPNMMTGFKEGKIAMIINGPWAISDILTGSQFKEVKDFSNAKLLEESNLGVTRIPKGEQWGSAIGGHAYVMFKSTKHPEESMTLMKFLNSKENQQKLALSHSLVPTRKSTYEMKAIKDHPYLPIFKQIIDTTPIRPVIPEGGQLFTALDPNFQAILSGKRSPKKAAERVDKNWERLLK